MQFGRQYSGSGRAGRGSLWAALRAALLLAGGLAVSAVLTSAPVRADCQPFPISSNDTVNCAVAGGTQTTSVGTGAEDNVTVNVQNGATIDVSATSANAIDLFDGNTVINAGTIVVDSGTGISANDDNVITNTGMIIAGAGGFGINVSNGNVVTNSGSIVVGEFGTGINVCCDNIVTNSGSIVAGDSSFGIFATDRNFITNTGKITVGSNGSYGILGAGDGFIGPGNATISNSGTITAGDTSFGIGAIGNYNVVNSGTISVGANGTGIQVDGGNTVTNSGTILTGAGGIGIQLNGFGDSTANTVTNSGSIIARDGFALFGVDNNAVTNNGFILGQVLLVGAGNTFTNNGYVIAGDPTTFTAPAGAFIADTLINGPSGTLAVRVAPTFNDSFVASTIQLNGRLQIVVTPGLYNTTTTYSQTSPVSFNTAPIQICGCGGTTLTGIFAIVESSSPFFIATPDYSIANEVDVTLTRLGFGSVPGLTRNQQAVGNALEAGYSTALTGNAASFYGNLLAATSITALDQLSGEGTSATQNAAFGAGSLFNNAMQNQALFGGGISVIVPPTAYTEERVARGHDAFAFLKAKARQSQPGRWRVWAAGFGAARSFDGESSTGSSDQKIRNYGGAFGFDHQAGPDLIVGLSVGGSESNFSVPDLRTSGQVTGGHLGVYGVKTWGATYAAAAVSYARFDNSTARDITGIGPAEFATGRFASDQLSARLELGWKHAYAHYTLTPFVAVEPAALWQRGYAESSTTAGGTPGILGLTVAARTATSVPTFVGLQADTRTVLPNGAVLTPFARASWVHEFLPDRRVTAAFISVPTAAFTVDGARAARDAGRLDAGAKLALGAGESLYANLAGEWSSRSQSYAATAGFRVVR